jgi:hypothetical protein
MRAKRLCLQQPPLQKPLHVPTTIDDKQNDNVFIQDSIDDAVGLEKNLAVFPNPQHQKFFRVGAALGGFGQAGKGFLDLLQNVISLLWRVAQCDIVIKFVEITCCVIGQQNRERHQRNSRRSRKCLITSAAGWTLPCSIWRLPSARIFRRAIVSWVCS